MVDPGFSHRDIESLNQSIRDLNGTIKELRYEMASTYVRKDVIEPQLSEMRQDIKNHSAWLEWAGRIVMGAVILALVSLVIYQGGALK